VIDISTSEMLFAGVGRTITSFDRKSGRPVWRIKLPRFFGGSLTMIAVGDELYVGRGSYVYCIDARRGEVVWERGAGSSASLVFLAVSGQSGTFAEQHAVATAMIQQQQAAAAGAAAAASASS
jgi:outer membrane protein assembly factor BamB